jgi:hypothetical protein
VKSIGRAIRNGTVHIVGPRMPSIPGTGASHPERGPDKTTPSTPAARDTTMDHATLIIVKIEISGSAILG